MKILFLLPDNSTGGGIFVVFEHAKRFHQKGHEVLIAFQREDTPIEIANYPGMSGIRTSYLKDVDESDVYDFAVATWWETAYAVNRVSAKHYCYFIQDNERNFYETPHRTNQLFIEKTFEENFYFFPISDFLRDMLQREFNKESTVVPVSINFEAFGADRIAYPKGDRVRVLVEGPGAQPRKRVSLAFSVLSEVPEVEVFYVCSDGYSEEGWRIDKLFHRVPYAEMPGIHASCDVLLKLSSQEAFPLPVIESFASGGCVVVSAFPGHDSYLKDGYNALVVPVDDKAAAVQALKRLVSDPDLRERLRAGAAETCSKYSWEKSNEIFENKLLQIGARPDEDRQQLLVTRRYEAAYKDYKRMEDEWRVATHDLKQVTESETYRLGRTLTAPLRIMRGR